MAQFSYDGVDALNAQLGKMADRGMIERIVKAGGQAAVDRMRHNIMEKRHAKTRDMLESVGMTDYRETLNGATVYVYPLGDDRKGQRNATKAFVINYGLQRHQHPHSADHFITGDAQVERIVQEAMAREAEKIIEEVSKG